MLQIVFLLICRNPFVINMIDTFLLIFVKYTGSEDKVGFSKKQKHSELCCVFWRRSTVAAGNR